MAEEAKVEVAVPTAAKAISNGTSKGVYTTAKLGKISPVVVNMTDGTYLAVECSDKGITGAVRVGNEVNQNDMIKFAQKLLTGESVDKKFIGMTTATTETLDNVKERQWANIVESIRVAETNAIPELIGQLMNSDKYAPVGSTVVTKNSTK